MNWRKKNFFGFLETMTDEQKIYVDSIFTNRLTIVDAISGSGKTTMAVAAAKLLGMPLLYLFSTVEEDKLGFSTGDIHQKESKYLLPLYDALLAIDENPMQAIIPQDVALRKEMDVALGKKLSPNKPMSNAWVEAKSHNFQRGSNVRGKFVIIDEAQNWTKPQLKKTLTRIHDDCKVVVIGHMEQCDLKNPSMSGFPRVIEHMGAKSYAEVCSLTKDFRGELAHDADEM